MPKENTEKINVLVTGVGAIIGQGIIKSLRKTHYPIRVFGVDQSDRSPGPSFCDDFFKKHDCDETHSEYLTFWQRILEKWKIAIVLVGLEVDMFFCNRQRFLFEQFGSKVVLNRPELIALCSDKWLLGETLKSYGVPSIPSYIPTTWNEAVKILGPPPLLFKPRHGNGSRGIVQLYDEIDFLYWRAKIEEGWMLQQIVGSDSEEYTVGVFGFGDGTSLPPIILRRRLSSAGNTLEAQAVEDAVIEDAVVTFTEVFRPVGPTNYQFRKQGDTAYLLEINPRFSSSNSLRTLFGYNEAEMCLKYFLFGEVPTVPKIRQGIAWRYNEDFVMYV